MMIYLLFKYLKLSEASHKKTRKEKVFAGCEQQGLPNFIYNIISHNLKDSKAYYSYAITP